MSGTALKSHLTSIPLARSSSTTGSRLKRLLASALVIVGDGFVPSLILWPEALTNEIATTSVNGSSHLFVGHFIMLQCYCATGDESTLPWLHRNVGTDRTY